MERSQRAHAAPSGEDPPFKHARIEQPDQRCHFDALHADIIKFIFSYLPLGGRLGVVNLVCRRWRALAYQSVTAVPSINSFDAIALFPALETLSLAHAPPLGTALPTTLRTLFLASNVYDSACVCYALEQLSTLTHLRADLHPLHSCTARLVCSNRLSLKTLDLCPIDSVEAEDQQPEQEQCDMLATVLLSELRDFRFELVATSAEATMLTRSLLSLASRVATQLVSLSIYIAGNDTVATKCLQTLSDYSYPLLTTLVLRVHTVTPEHVNALLKAAPRLATSKLTLHISEHATEVITLLAPTLTELEVEEPTGLVCTIHIACSDDLAPSDLCATQVLDFEESVRALVDCSALCTKLVSMRLFLGRDTLERITEHCWQPHASRLTELTPAPREQMAAFLAQCTALTSVTISPRLTPITVPLPNLTELGLRSWEAFDQTVRYVEALLASRLCPRLRIVSVNVSDNLPDTQRLRAWLYSAQQAGVERFIIFGDPNLATQSDIVQLTRAFKWMRVVYRKVSAWGEYESDEVDEDDYDDDDNEVDGDEDLDDELDDEEEVDADDM